MMEMSFCHFVTGQFDRAQESGIFHPTIRRKTPGRRALGKELKWIVEQIWMQKSRS
jgi:hypothetical protein